MQLRKLYYLFKKKKERTKYVKRQILENFYRRITEERGGKKGRKEKCYQCQAVFVSIGTSRGACWNVVLNIDTRTRYRANKSLIGFMRLIARKQKLWEYPISCILCASIHQDKQNISEATRAAGYFKISKKMLSNSWWE